MLAGGGVIAASAIIGWAGLRYPPPQFTPDAAPLESNDAAGGTFQARAEGAIYQGRDGDRFVFRAFTPEPEITSATAGEIVGVELAGTAEAGASIDVYRDGT